MMTGDISKKLLSNRSIRNYHDSINFVAILFWILFSLIYLFLNQLLLIATLDEFRLGFLALILGVALIIAYQKVGKNDALLIVITFLSFTILISGLINQTPLLQILGFIRIPIIFYLIYNLISQYLNIEKRVERVLSVLYIIAAVQLPILIIQRAIYPFLPLRLTLGLSSTDFGMGTFSGDTAMAFTLIGLVILLLFDRNRIHFIKYKLLLAGWLSFTILVSNSQIQHVAIILVWVVFFLSHLRIKTFMALILLFVVLISLIIFLSQTGLMTYPLLQNTLIKFSAVSQIFSKSVDYDVFLSGGYARGPAASYYLNQPLKWFGDGPGFVYDTVSGQRTVGAFGHAFTFYAEVGLVGWFLSILVFFVVAFPINVNYSSAKIRTSWVGALMFLAVMIVSIVKYPMGDISLVFTYCVILIGYQVLSRTNATVRFLSSAPSDLHSKSYSSVEA